MTETITKNWTKTNPNTPSDIKQVGTVVKYDILKYLRSSRLLGMIAIEALVLLLITVLPPLLGNSYAKTADGFINSYTSFVSTLIIVGATLFAGDAIVSEFQGRTGYLLFPNPVKRWTFLAGKFIASAGVMFFVLIIYYGIALSLGLAITGGFSTLGVESLLIAMVYSVAALAVGYLISSIMKGSTGSLILTFALFLFIFNIVENVLSISKVDPWFLITFAGQTIGNITQVPYPTGGSSNGAVGGVPPSLNAGAFVADVGVSILVIMAYAVIALLLSYYFFQKREMSA